MRRGLLLVALLGSRPRTDAEWVRRTGSGAPARPRRPRHLWTAAVHASRRPERRVRPDGCLLPVRVVRNGLADRHGDSWLQAFTGPVSCSVPAIRTAADAAARRAGFDVSSYDRVIYVHPNAGCPWSGATFARTVALNGVISRRVIAHELGHTFGLPHANATDCRRHAVGCDALEYGDPYDTMGSGVGDFSAKAKVDLGWIKRIGRPAAKGVYTLAPLETHLDSSSGLHRHDRQRPVLDRGPQQAGAERSRRAGRRRRGDPAPESASLTFAAGLPPTSRGTSSSGIRRSAAAPSFARATSSSIPVRSG